MNTLLFRVEEKSRKNVIYKNSYFYHVYHQQKILKDLYILIYCIYYIYLFIYNQFCLIKELNLFFNNYV